MYICLACGFLGGYGVTWDIADKSPAGLDRWQVSGWLSID
jgi:hypothetical protein